MGCDIHMFAELARGTGGWTALADGEFEMARSYALFAALAGVRAPRGFSPLISPRGLPTDLSVGVSSRFFVPVIEHERARGWGLLPWEFRTPEQAAFQAAQGAMRLPKDMAAPLLPATHGYIGAKPDSHTPSWVSLAELRPCLQHAQLELQHTPDEFRWLVRYLDAVEETAGTRTRLVFWFDN